MVAVGLGIGVKVGMAVVVEVSDGIGEGVAVTDCSHAMNNKSMMRKTKAWKRFFMLTRFRETMPVMLFAIFYREGGIVSK